jgi:hypothetical protein
MWFVIVLLAKCFAFQDRFFDVVWFISNLYDEPGAKNVTATAIRQATGGCCFLCGYVASSLFCLGRSIFYIWFGLHPGAKNVTTSASRPSRLAVVSPLESNLEGRVAATLQRALTINLDPTLYGSFAEIGAGQEVARMFFAAGAAAGTVAKSISAYDMTISDTFYGRCDR